MGGPVVAVLTGREENRHDVGLFTGDQPRSCLRLRGKSLLWYQLQGVKAQNREGEILLLTPTEEGARQLRDALNEVSDVRARIVVTSRGNFRGVLQTVAEEKRNIIFVFGDSVGMAPISKVQECLDGNEAAFAFAPGTWNDETPADAVTFIADNNRVLSIATKNGTLHLSDVVMKGLTEPTLLIRQGFFCGCIGFSGEFVQDLAAAAETTKISDWRQLLAAAAGSGTRVAAVPVELKSPMGRLLCTSEQFKDFTLRLCQTAQIKNWCEGAGGVSLELPAKSVGKDGFTEASLPSDATVKKSFIARGVSVGSGVTIAQSVLCEGAEVGDRCMINGCVLGAGCKIAPGVNLSDCRVEPGAEVTESAKKLSILC